MLRTIVRILAVLRMLAPFAAILLLWLTSGGVTSLVVVAPSGLWLLAAYFVTPIVLGLALWFAAGAIKA